MFREYKTKLSSFMSSGLVISGVAGIGLGTAMSAYVQPHKIGRDISATIALACGAYLGVLYLSERLQERKEAKAE